MIRNDIESYRLAIETITYLVTEDSASQSRLAKTKAKQFLFSQGRTNTTKNEEKVTAEKLRGDIRNALKAVEREFGVTLTFKTRERRESQPTPEALPFIQKLQVLVDAYEKVVGIGRATIRISAIDFAVQHWIPVALKNALSAGSDSPNIICKTREWWRVLSDVDNGYADFGFAPSMPSDAVHEEVILNRRHVAVFSPEKEDLVSRDAITEEDFIEHGAICLHSFAAPVAATSHLPFRKARMVQVNTSMQAAAWAAQGLGIAILAEELSHDDSRLISRPLSFQVIDAVDSLYAPKKKDGKNKSVEIRLTDEARVIYDAIAQYWKTYEFTSK